MLTTSCYSHPLITQAHTHRHICLPASTEQNSKTMKMIHKHIMKQVSVMSGTYIQTFILNDWYVLYIIYA